MCSSDLFATVGSPGVEAAEGKVALAPNLPGWGRQGLIDAVQEELGTKIRFENDVNLATLGEQWRGRGKGVENFVDAGDRVRRFSPANG